MGCGVAAPKRALLRVVARDGRAVPDPASRLPGRGAYLHPGRGCTQHALRRRALPRALRTPVEVPAETVDWITEWPRSASTR